LAKFINDYKIPKRGGKLIKGHLITISGLLAMSHLVGVTAVTSYLKGINDGIPIDGNGKKCTDYLALNNFELIF
jgi:hypothetical protein